MAPHIIDPSTTGLAERFVQSFRNAMKATQTKDSLSLHIARFLLAYRNAHCDRKSTSLLDVGKETSIKAMCLLKRMPPVPSPKPGGFE